MLMVIVLEVAVELGVVQGALLVNTQVILSPCTKVLVVYVIKPVPTLVPFFFHW